MKGKVGYSMTMTARERNLKLGTLVLTTALTLAIHYGWVQYLFGHYDWLHALHSRFCYIPIVIGAAWFGLRGGILTAAVISLLVVPYLYGHGSHEVDLTQELVEIFFYFAIGGLIGALIDREERIRRKHEETERYLERSQHLSLLGQMAAGVAHEIKNPLASIKGAVEILSDCNTPETDRKEFREIVSSEIRRIDGTVRDFLEFGRPREPRYEEIDLSATVAATIKQVEAQAGAVGVSLRTNIDEGVVVLGDREKLHQVILNLILNALDASAHGSHIDICVTERARHSAVLAITDHGRGIAPGDLDKVFEPFFSTKATGTGLGLPIVKAIIEKHQGNITLESRLNHGTTATVTLPLFREVV
ncbi:MAG: ATP-binding protein [Candidatus Zixiibacteriota bacterium]